MAGERPQWVIDRQIPHDTTTAGRFILVGYGRERQGGNGRRGKKRERHRERERGGEEEKREREGGGERERAEVTSWGERLKEREHEHQPEEAYSFPRQ